MATAGEVVARLVGEAGPAGDPQFRIALDGKEIGVGSVSPAVPTGIPGGGFRAVADVASVTRSFTFQVPDEALRTARTLTVEFLNDASDATTKADANLYVAGLSIDGIDVPLQSGTIATSAGQPKPSGFVKDTLGIYWNATASFPVPQEVVAAAGNTAPPAPAPAPTAPAPAPAAPAPAAPTPAPAPATPAPTATACTVRSAVAITDFGSSARNLSSAARSQLDTFAADKDIAGCELKVVGYASTDGRASVNQSLSQARAEAVAAYLRGKGFAKVTAEGAGETQQFGTGAANRRVVVTVVKP